MTRNKQFKTKLLGDIAIENNASIICLTESHLRKCILDAEVEIKDYEIIRADRLEGMKKGGVAVYVKKDLIKQTKVLKRESNGEVEHLLLYFSKWKLALSTIYRPPYCTTINFANMIKTIEQELLNLGNPEPNIIILGDFNLPIIRWNESKGTVVYGGSTADRQQSNLLLSFMDRFLLKQMMNAPTRGRNILDLAMTNNDEIFSNINVEDTVMSDHRVAIIRTSLEATSETRKTWEKDSLASLDFRHKNTDWNAIREATMKTDWPNIFINKTSDDKYNAFYNKMLDICKQYTPVRRQYTKGNIPRDRRILMRKRTNIRKAMAKTINMVKIEEMKGKLHDIEIKLAQSHTEELKARETKAIEKIKSNPKYFYAYARSKAVTRCSIGPLLYRDELVSEPGMLVTAFNEQYASAFSKPMDDYGSIPWKHVNYLLSDIQVSANDLEKILANIKEDAAAGPDQIPAILLKRCAKGLSKPLSSLWQSSLDEGKIPATLKHGLVTPIYKGGNKTEPKQYRPVTLTSHIIKTFERLLVTELRKHMQRNKLYNPGQHGFMENRSCLSQLLQYHTEIINALESGQHADTIYLDFAKAFDKVDHHILGMKLEKQFGITGKLLAWIKDFFADRTQSVVVEGVESDKIKVSSGVAQGSVIGPMLFIMFMTDIDQEVDYCQTTSFADDTRMLGKIQTIEDCNKMQRDITKIYSWSKSNNMKFNSSKCVLLRYTHPRQEPLDFTYQDPTGEIIQEKTETRDLGITMSNEADFDVHINNTVNKAKQQMGWILRSFNTREAQPMMTLFKTMILPTIEYCSQLWCPTSIGQIRMIEAVQRTFTSRLQHMEHMNYWERLKYLKLYSLERRRERYMIIYVWKIINGYAPNLDHPNAITVKDTSRRGPICALPPFNNTYPKITTLKEKSFAVFGPKLYNCLPRNLREVNCSLPTFKSKLDEFLLTIPDQPALPHYYQPSPSNSLIHQLHDQRYQGGASA